MRVTLRRVSQDDKIVFRLICFPAHWLSCPSSRSNSPLGVESKHAESHGGGGAEAGLFQGREHRGGDYPHESECFDYRADPVICKENQHDRRLACPCLSAGNGARTALGRSFP